MLIIASLIFLGILLMLIEMLLIPGVGVAGVLSLASLTASCWYAFSHMGTKAGIIATLIVICLLIVMLVYILREKTWKRFELQTEIQSRTNDDPDKVTVGQQGQTLTRLAPIGTARFDGLSCEVKSADGNMIGPGVQVEITSIEENKIFVKPINL